MSSDARLFSAACERNRGPILEVLREVLPEGGGTLLEVASGTGMHGAWMAPQLPGWRWQPTDQDADALASIAAWRAFADAGNLSAPVPLDVLADPWPVTSADAIFNANMIHISPWECTQGLFRGAGAALSPGAPLITYGPYLRAGVETAPSNLRFDASLKARDPRWGIRALEDVAEVAAERGLTQERVFEMPANNLCVVWRRG